MSFSLFFRRFRCYSLPSRSGLAKLASPCASPSFLSSTWLGVSCDDTPTRRFCVLKFSSLPFLQLLRRFVRAHSSSLSLLLLLNWCNGGCRNGPKPTQTRERQISQLSLLSSLSPRVPPSPFVSLVSLVTWLQNGTHPRARRLF
jgi:hypothetical protein